MSASNHPHTIKSFQDASEYLGNKDNRPYAHNTRIKRVNLDHIIITYHDNPIVTFVPGQIILSSCGWKTSTTKERLNWFIPNGFRIYQDKSIWYLSGGYESWKNAKQYIFQDGITILSDGTVTGDLPAESDNTKKTIKAIHKYVDGYVKALLNGKMDKPSSGDCWYCFMHTDDNESLGDATHNNEHILSHFEESYYVPSMLYNAFNHNKRLCEFSKDGIARLTDEDLRGGIYEWQKEIVARDVKSCLTAYLKHALGIAQ